MPETNDNPEFIKAWNERLNCPSFAIYTPYPIVIESKPEVTEDTRMWKLKHQVTIRQRAFTEMLAAWTNPATKKRYESRTLFVFQPTYKTAVRLARKFEKKSIIFKDDAGCREVLIYPDHEETGRVFEPEGGDGLYTIDNARQIFAYILSADMKATERQEGATDVAEESVKDVSEESSTDVAGESAKDVAEESVKDVSDDDIEKGIEMWYVTQPKPSMFRGGFGNVRILDAREK